MPNRSHSYKLTAKQFNLVIKEFNFASKTIKALRAILVDGKTYEAAGKPYGIKKQFLYPRVHKVLHQANLS